jgi:hypothetical protein
VSATHLFVGAASRGVGKPRWGGRAGGKEETGTPDDSSMLEGADQGDDGPEGCPWESKVSAARVANLGGQTKTNKLTAALVRRVPLETYDVPSFVARSGSVAALVAS